MFATNISCLWHGKTFFIPTYSKISGNTHPLSPLSESVQRQYVTVIFYFFIFFLSALISRAPKAPLPTSGIRRIRKAMV
jgi:hypothetical protein